MIKSVFNRSLILCMLVGVLFASCKKDYDTPPITTLPIGTVYSISDIIAMESGTVFTEDASVYGIVTDDEVSGNLYKAAYIQDRATGAALNLFLDASSGVRIGDSIRVYLKGVTYMMYNGLPQLSNFEPDGHIVILANQKYIEPAVATIEEITAGKYLGGLVKLENVMFTEKTTFAEVGTYGNRTLVDPSNMSQSVIVRTSNYANFAMDSLPQGTGSLIAIASVYNSTWQLLIRSVNELDFDGYNPGGNDSVQSLPYYQSFSSSFGTYSTYNVAGEQTWEIDYSTAKMTGYENSTNYANEDWLISSPVSFEGVSNVNMTMTYIARYFNNLNEDITIQVSSDYISGEDPASATWTAVPATWTSGSDWTNFISTDVDLSQFAGQTVSVAVKYISTDTKAGTIEVQSIVIQEGNGGGGNGGDIQPLPYTQSFTSEFGTYTTQDVFGSQTWTIDYSTAKMTGYENSTNYANEDWLISSPADLTGVSNAKLSMTYIARFFSNLNSDITIQVSSNYTFGNDPAYASWTEVPASWTSGSDWTNFATTEVSLNDFVGQTVSVAVKYTSTDTKAGTIEIQSITIEEGNAGGGGGTAGGSGTADDPYNVASAIQLQGQGTTAWIEGYIVGCVKTGETSVTTSDQINWTTPFTNYTNVVIADDATETNIANCVIVNLPSGKPLRAQVNLFDNPDNYGKALAVLGTLRTYFGQAGLRDSDGSESSFVLEGGGIVPPSGETIFSETFAAGQGAFTIQDVVLPSELTYVWNYASQYSCMKASAFVGQAYETESWLVSPAIDLSAVSAATMTFDNAVNYHSNPNDALSIMVSTNYAGNVQSATWTEISLSAWPSGSDWTFISSSADLSSFAGQSITVAFKYSSTTSQAATWEVKNLVIE
jgi:hypothetical protein